jgi:hypothetical protein
MKEKKKLLISFSGGRTSAYMLWWLVNEWAERHEWEMVIVFANTGKEHEETLLFVERCAKNFRVDIVWVEAKHLDEQGKPFSDKGWAVKHKIVSFETASRNGEPFEEMISVLGIPSTEAPFCSDQLKRKAIESYLKSIGWGTDFTKAIGVRIDEIDRANERWRENKIYYPLCGSNPTKKTGVVLWWLEQEFDLQVPEGFGNCDNCWKKGIPDLVKNAKKDPSSFDWWQEMTDKYGYIKNRPGQQDMKPPFNFYRGNISPKEILKLTEMSADQLNLFAEDNRLNSCSESCEAF